MTRELPGYRWLEWSVWTDDRNQQLQGYASPLTPLASGEEPPKPKPPIGFRMREPALAPPSPEGMLL